MILTAIAREILMRLKMWTRGFDISIKFWSSNSSRASARQRQEREKKGGQEAAAKRNHHGMKTLKILQVPYIYIYIYIYICDVYNSLQGRVKSQNWTPQWVFRTFWNHPTHCLVFSCRQWQKEQFRVSCPWHQAWEISWHLEFLRHFSSSHSLKPWRFSFGFPYADDDKRGKPIISLHWAW